MKKILKSIAALSLIVFAASCSKEADLAPAGEEALVNFTVSTPQLMTKAIADGNTVDKVSCNVYDETGALVTNTDITKTISISGGKATYAVRLITGHTYSFIFWAYKEGAPYTFDAAAKTVTVDYTGVANDESRDAFYAYVAPIQIAGSLEKSIILNRPFAQVNFGVNKSDITAASKLGIEVKKSSLKLTGLANVLNLVDGTVKGDATADYTIAALPAEDLKVKNVDYGYVSMGYVLVGKDAKTLSDVTLKIYKEDGTEVNTVSVPNVPLQGNYRTNILGNLFTSQASFNLVIDPAFEEPDYEVEIWDGTTINEPATDANGNYLITKASELAWVSWLADTCTAYHANLADKVFILQNDIDLRNNAWTPIGSPSHLVACTFDGNGKTISNLNTTVLEVAEGNVSAGLFGGIAGTTIKNLTVKNAIVNSTHYAGAICGLTEGTSYIENCKVINATVVTTPEKMSDGTYDNGDKAGAVIGYSADTRISGCVVENATITGYRDLGGVIGYLNSSASLKNCSVKNVTINVNNEHNYKGYSSNSEFDAGSIIGQNASTGEVSGNTGTATINYPKVVIPATTQESLDEAAATKDAVVELAAGTYTIPSNTADGVTIKGASKDETIINMSTGIYLNDKNVTIENVTCKSEYTNYVGIMHAAALTYKDCAFEGKQTMYAAKAEFINCSFKATIYDYCVWTYGSADITFTDCTFDTMGKAVKVYREGSDAAQNVTFDNCTFKAANIPAGKGKAAVEINRTLPNGGTGAYNVVLNNCTETGFVAGEFSGKTLWNVETEKDGTYPNQCNIAATVTVNGKVEGEYKAE